MPSLDNQSRLVVASLLVDANVRKYFSRIGKKGGKQTTDKKLTAVRANLEKALQSTRRYPPCPHPAYKNHAHRFDKKTDRCFGCKRTRAELEAEFQQQK